ncbi:hypothetical protein TNCV_4664511 [Trichonephila clavipes]|nr:hypothetical protein TNCV_4664511 [Trichonephila clavipes]
MSRCVFVPSTSEKWVDACLYPSRMKNEVNGLMENDTHALYGNPTMTGGLIAKRTLSQFTRPLEFNNITGEMNKINFNNVCKTSFQKDASGPTLAGGGTQKMGERLLVPSYAPFQ